MKLEDYYKPFEDFEKDIIKKSFKRIFKQDVENKQVNFP